MKNTIYLLLILVCSFTLAQETCENDHYKIEKLERFSKKNKKNNVTSAKLKNNKISLVHYPAKGQNERVRFLVLHYTAADLGRSVFLLTEKEVSSHYLVSDKKEDNIFMLVSEDKRAWHAGYSNWQGRENLNDTSIGIEIVNPGYEGEFNFIPFDDSQFEKVALLAKNIVSRYNICETCVVGHSDIAPQRKHDPGPLFSWEKLYYEYGVGAWYDPHDLRIFLHEYYTLDTNSKEFIEKIQNDLKKYGYDIEASGIWDEKTRKVIRVFQYHFRPSKYDGILDLETYSILQALLKKYFNKK